MEVLSFGPLPNSCASASADETNRDCREGRSNEEVAQRRSDLRLRMTKQNSPRAATGIPAAAAFQENGARSARAHATEKGSPDRHQAAALYLKREQKTARYRQDTLCLLRRSSAPHLLRRSSRASNSSQSSSSEGCKTPNCAVICSQAMGTIAAPQPRTTAQQSSSVTAFRVDERSLRL